MSSGDSPLRGSVQTGNIVTVPSRDGTSPIGTTSPNTGATGATNSTYGQGAFASGVSDQTGNVSYALQNTDYQGIIIFNTGSPIAVSCNQAVGTNFGCTILNLGTGQITLTPDGGLLVNGGASLTGASGAGFQVFFANRKWFAYSGVQSFPTIPANTPAIAHEWLNSYNASTGAFTQTQPAYSDISGTPIFVDNEVVAGTGTAWTLANTPAGIPILFVILPAFGLIGLVKDSVAAYGYTLSGTTITTVTSYTAGSLIAWYRK